MSSFDTALNFGATATAKITIPSNTEFSGASTLTISFWKRNLSYVYNSGVIGGTGWPPNTKDPFWITQWYGGMKANFADGTSGASVNYGFSSSDYLWHHYVVTFDNGVIKTYTDGVYSGNTATASFTATNVSASSYIIGDVTSRVSSGFLSNMQVFNSSLSEPDILTLYNGGEPLTDMSGFPSMRSWWKLDNTTTGVVDAGPAALGGAGNGEAEEVSTFVSTNIGVSVWMTDSNLVNASVSALNGRSSGMTTANLVASDLTRSIPYSSYSMDFDGTADYISVSDVSNIATNTQGSISFWINFVGDSSTRYAFGISDTNADTFLTIGINLYENLDIILRNTAAPNIWRLTTSGSPIVLDTWQHICLTQDGTACEVYVNGAKPTQSGAGTEWLNDLSGLDLLTIGALYKNSALQHIECKISNVSIWDTALSEDQIQTIYNGGVPNSISSLSPVGWWSLAGDSYYNGSDWICPDLGSGGNNGTSSGMGGTELVGDGPGSTANGIATSMDIPTNLKGEAPNSTSNAISINMTAVDRVTSVPG